jgi:hypothetical protein
MGVLLFWQLMPRLYVEGSYLLRTDRDCLSFGTSIERVQYEKVLSPIRPGWVAAPMA